MSECKRIHLSDGEVSRVIRDARADAIEECARVAEEGWRLPHPGGTSLYEDVAAAIRALKKP